MAVKAVFFDVGETLVDETRYWSVIARGVGVTPHVIWAALGAVIERGEHHRRVYDLLGVEPPSRLDAAPYDAADFYPDVLGCLHALKRRGYVIGVAGNTAMDVEEWVRGQDLPLDVVASSASWGVEKPARAFFERIVAAAACEPSEVAYVGDRIDNDVLPALDVGIVAVHVRRGPWGYLQRGGERAHVRVHSLAELPHALADV